MSTKVPVLFFGGPADGRTMNVDRSILLSSVEPTIVMPEYDVSHVVYRIEMSAGEWIAYPRDTHELKRFGVRAASTMLLEMPHQIPKVVRELLRTARRPIPHSIDSYVMDSTDTSLTGLAYDFVIECDSIEPKGKC